MNKCLLNPSVCCQDRVCIALIHEDLFYNRVILTCSSRNKSQLLTSGRSSQQWASTAVTGSASQLSATVINCQKQSTGERRREGERRKGRGGRERKEKGDPMCWDSVSRGQAHPPLWAQSSLATHGNSSGCLRFFFPHPLRFLICEQHSPVKPCASEWQTQPQL